MVENGSGSPVRVWTFLLIGGESFRLALPGNPLLDHTGGTTLWKLVGTRELAESAGQLMTLTGVTVRVFTEEQTPEQARIRQQQVGQS